MQNLKFAIPILAITVCGMTLRRLCVHRRPAVPLAFAAGQGVSFAAVVVIALFSSGGAGSALLDFSLDLVVIPVLVLMLVRRPSRPWLYALIAYESHEHHPQPRSANRHVGIGFLVHDADLCRHPWYTAAVTASMALPALCD